MSPTDILRNEHRVIETVIDALEAIASTADKTGSLNQQDASDALLFFREFADRVHHGKEEARLFPAMERKGFDPELGPTNVMRQEHEVGRAHVREMLSIVDDAAQGNRHAIDRFIEHASEFATMLRMHIQKEDHCLFGMVDRAFDADDQASLLDAFDDADQQMNTNGSHERWLALANQLASRYGLSRHATHAGDCASCASLHATSRS